MDPYFMTPLKKVYFLPYPLTLTISTASSSFFCVMQKQIPYRIPSSLCFIRKSFFMSWIHYITYYTIRHIVYLVFLASIHFLYSTYAIDSLRYLCLILPEITWGHIMIWYSFFLFLWCCINIFWSYQYWKISC